jgi:hypothetical protein
MDNDTMHLNLAGWHVRLDIDPPALGAAIAQRYAPFHSPNSGEVAEFIVEISAEATTEASASVLNTKLTTNKDIFLLDDSHFYGMIAPDQGRASLHIRSDAVARETEYFLRVALALFAFHSGGLLVHCAALKAGAHAYLFIGQSGSGKSTVVSLSRAGRRATALGDDLILIRQEDQGWWAYGTPFWNLETKDREGQVDSGPFAPFTS